MSGLTFVLTMAETNVCTPLHSSNKLAFMSNKEETILSEIAKESMFNVMS